MRAIFVVALLALPALATPQLRWLDETGGLREVALTRVESESLTSVIAILENGKKIEVPGRTLIELVREDDQNADQRRLLDARQSLAAGLADSKHIKLLDRLAADGKEDWIREYAAATRALLAQRLEEEDAAQRLEAFLEKHPNSRFVCHVLIAQAWLKTDKPGAGTDEVMEYFMPVAEEIHKRSGSLYQVGRCLLESTRIVHKLNPASLEAHIGYMEAASFSQEPGICDIVIHKGFGTLMWLERVYEVRDNLLKAGKKPYGPRRDAVRLANTSGLLLPEVQCEVQLGVAQLELDLEHEEEARAALEKARTLARNPYRRAVVEERLKALTR